jgi:uncharacterized coiled-coil protein SlyX
MRRRSSKNYGTLRRLERSKHFVSELQKGLCSLKREHRRFLNGENSLRFPWCPPDDDDEEETDINECAKSARNPRKPITEILKEQQQRLSDLKEQEKEFENTLTKLNTRLAKTQTRYDHVNNKLKAMTPETWNELFTKAKGGGGGDEFHDADDEEEDSDGLDWF